MMEIGDREIAGFLDGDGCIGIYRTHKRRSASWHYVLHLVFAQSREDHAEILKDIQIRYGGCLIKVKDNPDHPFWHPRYALRMTGWGALKLILAVKSHLRVRAPQAEIAEKFMNYRLINTGSARKGMSFRTMRLAPEHLEFYEDCRQEMRHYNRRGIEGWL